jgi:hypothetical protein
MSAAPKEEELTLTGPPRNMAVVVPRDEFDGRVVPISISVGGEPAIYRAVVRRHGRDLSEIRLRLPEDTPPGTYSGEGTIGGRQRGVVVEVEPVQRVRVHPRATVVTAAASSNAEFMVSVLNSGNVPFEIAKEDTFDLDDDSGQDRALGRALRAPLGEGESRVDRFFDELRASHGGEARVVVKSGAGRLMPGESRELSCVLEVPPSVREGHSYAGSWAVGNGVHVVIADIITTGRPKNGRAKS